VLPFVELGVGLSMITSVAQAIGRKDDEAIRSAVASAMVTTCGVALVVGVVWSAVFPWVEWKDALGLHTASEAEVRLALHLVVLSLCLGLPASLGYRLLFAEQRADVVAWLQLGAAAASFLLAISMALLGAGPAAFVGAALLPAVAVSAATSVVLAVRREMFRPRLRYATIHDAVDLLRLGSVFSVQQLALTLGSQIDTIVISRSLGAGAVSTYGVAARLANGGTQISSAMFVPLWPAFGEATGSGDRVWVRRTLRRALLLGTAGAVICVLGFALLGPMVQKAWAGAAYTPDRRLMIAFGLLGALQFLQLPAQMLLNAKGVARMQLIAVVAMLAVNLPLTLLLVRPVGTSGPVFATVIATAVCLTIPSILRAVREA
jgi:O-antigen/teichoic acid export membrane protein